MTEKLRFLQSLSQTYDVRPVELKAGAERFRPIVRRDPVIGPKTALPPRGEGARPVLIQGKAVALFLDRVQVDLQKFAGATEEQKHGLDEWLKVNGVTLGPSLVADVSSASINISEQRGYMWWSDAGAPPFLAVVKQLGVAAITRASAVLFPFTTEVSVAAVPASRRRCSRAARTSRGSKAQPPNVDHPARLAR